MDLNRVQLIGRITQDHELKQTPSGTSVLSFSLVTNYVYKDKNTGQKNSTAEYHNCVAWRGLADTMAKYTGKGSKIFLEGKLQTRTWDDPTGAKRYKTEIIVESMILLESRGDVQEVTRVSNDADDAGIDNLPF